MYLNEKHETPPCQAHFITPFDIAATEVRRGKASLKGGCWEKLHVDWKRGESSSQA